MSSTVVSPLTLHRARLQADLLAHYDELIARTSWDRERIRDHQRARLRPLLRHAATRSRFHAERLRGVDVDSIEPDDLTALPVMTKSELMERFDDVVTDPAASPSPTRRPRSRAPTGSRQRCWARCSSWPPAAARAVAGCSCTTHPPAGSSSVHSPAASWRGSAPPEPRPGVLRIAMVAAGSPVHATGAAVVADGGR